ncbi:MAG: PSD1 and planctomycete cytochrome C domain-containing protein [Bryobacteraceae bacterium]
MLALFLLAAAADPNAFFEENIRPLLAARCIGCHGDAKVSGLRLDSREGFLTGGRRGAALVPGDAAASLFVRAVRRSADLQMPPGDPLAEAEIANLEAWVRAGAPWPKAQLVRTTGKITGEQRAWWAFRPLAPAGRVPSPSGRARTPIDAYILDKLERDSIKPVAPASPRALIRRLSIDLTGLPPTPAEVEHYERNQDTAALVERLLASRQFGERWGRFWLDVARYGEDDVLGLSQERYPNAWRYRDWVIDAWNRDLPYDVFLKAQLAADQMPSDPGFDLRPALGFLGLGPWQYTVSPPPQARADERHDRIDVVTRGFLGLTAACARCHDHKFDPITTRDYYGLGGVFASTEYREIPLAAETVVHAQERHRSLMAAKKKEISEFVRAAQDRVSARLSGAVEGYLREEGRDRDGNVLARMRRYLARPQFDHPFLPKLADDPAALARLIGEVRVEKAAIDEEKRIALERARPPGNAAKTRLPNGYETYDEFCPGCDVAVRAMDRDRFMLWQDLFRDGGVLRPSEAELPAFLSTEERLHLQHLRTALAALEAGAPEPYPFLHAVADKARVANLRIAQRGDPYTLGDETPRRFLEVLSGPVPQLWTESSGRLELATAIASHPLAARVAANRVWFHLFGRGIVNSPSNFGRLGDRPTHPELLDYLASRLVANRWSMKALIREIVLTDTYQRSSAIDAAGHDADPANKLYWRHERRRLDAESLRDSILAASGSLDAAIGGPSEELGPDCRRRTVYGRVSRFRLNPTLELFDFPSPAISAEKRNVTQVPLQRLYFLNNEFLSRQSEALAGRLENSRDPAGEAYRLVFARAPLAQERQLAEDFLREATLKELARVLLTTNEFLFVD